MNNEKLKSGLKFITIYFFNIRDLKNICKINFFILKFKKMKFN